MIFLFELAALLIGALLAELRWLRVAQREHYLAGSASIFALRWWRSSPLNLILGIASAFTAIAAFWESGSSFACALIVAISPIGLTPRGRTSKLVWTPRLRRVSAISTLIYLVPIGILTSLISRRAVIGVSTAFVLVIPVIVDLGLAFMAPIERRFAKRFVDSAKERLRRISPQVIAITGSFGKTTTKGYVDFLLQRHHNVLASPRSFNNQAGLARTVNEHLLPGTEILIAEMGTYGLGEIRAMCEWMKPSIAVITAIGPVHLERFKDLNVTLAAKAEIAEGADICVLNVDDERLAALAQTLRDRGKKVISCSGIDRGADICVLIDDDRFTVFQSGQSCGQRAVTEADRAVVATNVACAIGVCVAVGDDLSGIVSAISSLPSAPNRLVSIESESGVLILDDTFNSNPAGAALALSVLKGTGLPGARRVLVTPGMIELGPIQAEENRRMAELASQFCSEVVIVNRTNRRALSIGANHKATVRYTRNRDIAVAWVKENLQRGDVVLYENDLPDHYA